MLAELVQDVGGRGASQSPERYAYLRKLDGRLQAVAASRLGTGGPASAAVSAARQGITTSPGGEVPVDVYVAGDVPAAAGSAARPRHASDGHERPAAAAHGRGVLAGGPLPAAAALPAARAILTPVSNLSTGSVLSQGDGAIHGPQARAFGAGGAGVKVA